MGKKGLVFDMNNNALCSRGLYIVLGLFLGGFGVHNFVAGYIHKAIVQLVITTVGMLASSFSDAAIILNAGVCFWVLVELFSVRQDAYGVRMR